MARLSKPKEIKDDPFKSAKWDELTRGRSFTQSDAPSLALLCHWHAVAERCMRDMDYGGELPQAAYQDGMGDLKTLPQIATMKQASAEQVLSICQLAHYRCNALKRFRRAAFVVG